MTAVAISKNGVLAASSDADKTIRVYTLADAKPRTFKAAVEAVVDVIAATPPVGPLTNEQAEAFKAQGAQRVLVVYDDAQHARLYQEPTPKP